MWPRTSDIFILKTGVGGRSVVNWNTPARMQSRPFRAEARTYLCEWVQGCFHCAVGSGSLREWWVRRTLLTELSWKLTLTEKPELVSLTHSYVQNRRSKKGRRKPKLYWYLFHTPNTNMSMNLYKLPNTFQPRKQLLFIQRRPPSGTGENMREGPLIQNGSLLTAGRVVRKLPGG